ncbi:MAG: carboxypeptidase-like regulatory domain-containing protein, partial [Woeseiaceae bacterium]|nr:carboxypeptidase-like regulatory domain-containing protein [Woeseiaceae bacterium]
MLGAAAPAAPIDDRMTLVEAIAEVRALGHDVSYSSRLVKDWMRVRETPESDDAIEALDAALQAYDLGLASGPDGRWLVVRSQQEGAGRLPILVSGRVIDGDNGLALPGAKIGSRARRTPVVATADGTFRLDVLAAALLPVTFSAPGYRPRVVSYKPGDVEQDVVVELEPLAPPTI